MTAESTESGDDDLIDALWHQVRLNFDSDEHHAKFIEHCRTRRCLNEAAKRYRSHRENTELEESADAIVAKRLTAITLIAMAEFEATSPPTEGPSRARRLVNILGVLLFVLSVALLVYALML